jgi:hypothetical protein
MIEDGRGSQTNVIAHVCAVPKLFPVDLGFVQNLVVSSRLSGINVDYQDILAQWLGPVRFRGKVKLLAICVGVGSRGERQLY